MWILLLAMFLAPAALVWFSFQGLQIPLLQVWVVALGLPPFLLFLLLPRRYRLDSHRLVIEGLFYRKEIALAEISAIEREPLLGALLKPGSLFCTDPARALRIERHGKLPVVISPDRPEAFLQIQGGKS